MENLNNASNQGPSKGEAATHTINHIYLMPDNSLDQYNSWTEKITSLAHSASDEIRLKPIVDLLITAISPERIFMINYKGLPQHRIDSYTEILVIVDDEDVDEDQYLDFVILAFSQHPDILVSLGGASEVRGYQQFGSPYHCSHFRNQFQVYSRKRSVITEMDQDQLDKLKSEADTRFQTTFSRARQLFAVADEFLKEENPDLGAFMLYQTLHLLYQSVINAFKGPIPETFSAAEYQKVAEDYLPIMARNNHLAHLLNRLEQACSLQGQHNYQNSKVSMELLSIDVNILMNICETAIACKLSQFDSPSATIETKI
ncbi:hypothetical protein [Dyadobacter frigoris]|uniref:HEPN domain-containing protein n=1 Tax=Dyadobacter frigoris TaxID=2576211 RepID=A0A4U6CZ28_9BACT|nr:hypothetical protein [Dyadobacter frigoris]TKT88608.1 hypothetical protein FDK13_27065 [Dyadobacter frigoris]GLU54941.1 hypothetical protein Dfri01_44020 [Dyadobacter frigoris]